MKISLIKSTGITTLTLPKKISGSYWLEDTDLQNKSRKLVNIDASGDSWILKSNIDVKVFLAGQMQKEITIKENTFYSLVFGNSNENILIYSENVETNYTKYKVSNENTITIGNDTNANIYYNCSYLLKEHLKLSYNNNWIVEPQNVIFVNNNIVTKKQMLKHGDVIFAMGLRIIICGNNIYVNNPNDKVKVNGIAIDEMEENVVINSRDEINFDEKQFSDKDYFYRAPRFVSPLVEEVIRIDAPPTKRKPDDTPIIYQIGPMITMGLSTVVMGITSISSVISGDATWKSVMPTVVVAIAMLCAMLLWPLLLKRFNDKKIIKEEKNRQEKYLTYLESKRKQIKETIIKQRNIMEENYLDIDKCKDIIKTRNKRLWERKIEHEDFLKLRLGMGTITPLIKLEYPEEHFEVEVDDLKEKSRTLVKEMEDKLNVPIAVDFKEKKVSAFIGNYEYTSHYLDALLLKIMAFHSYDDVKIVFFTNKQNSKRWQYLKNSAYVWDDKKEYRFFATTPEEISQISKYLKDVLNKRKYTSDGKINQADYKSYDPYYIIITDNFTQNRNVEIIKELLETEVNYGFNLFIQNQKLLGLPDECSMFINIEPKGTGYFENELSINKQKAFEPDIDFNLDMNYYTKVLSNIPIALEKEKYYLPKMLSFLEMYNAGTIEQLNIEERWMRNNPIQSLKAPVGIDENGEIFNLDLHERFHGPHGLIAGMTGSGKSEFIISYILSMAINYHPNEVAFALIDYKGGGLTGAFENKETGVKLPHLLGTITNLDTIEMNRSLASIQSELKRRQRLFNEAREFSGESTIDIYKYQRLFREGKVTEPVPHLFIISDEFAELKSQQPDFMTQLISTARIGRSLGVHLILSTQKPSGVVDDQIWSNSRFRVCLKVQDKSDSMDMIKRPEAAALKDVGRFYLQVGYDELFVLGQSAYSGAKYYKQSKIKKKVDSDLEIVDNVGYIMKSVDMDKTNKTLTHNGEQLNNIVKYIYDIATKNNIQTQRLWLDKIEDFIYIKDLIIKYKYQPKKFDINPVIGEYDDPNNQIQDLLTMPLSSEGNTIIYGSSGSGKELLISSLIYSTVMLHGVDEVNFYIIDCGAETLTSFKNIPHVGDVLLSNEEEKINNLFKFIGGEILYRKKLFTEYNGNYKNYIENSGNTLPTIIFIINYFEIFNELYPDLYDLLISFTREANKYGIVIILSTTSPSSLRYKLSQNFKQEFVLQLNDVSDYSAILGNVQKKYPSKVKGRGLIKLDNIYEFQTAYMCLEENKNEMIKKLENYLNSIYKTKAYRIPILPNEIHAEDFKDELSSIKEVPIGINKENLLITKFNMSNIASVITSIDLSILKRFGIELYKEFEMISKSNVFIDANKLFEEEEFNNYINSNYDIVFEKIINMINTNYECNCFISGINEFLGNLNTDNKKKFEDLLMTIGVKNVHFILIDTMDNYKILGYERWFKKITSMCSAVWLGEGIENQFIISLTKRAPRLTNVNMDNFGYAIKNGNPIPFKILGSRSEEYE